MKKIVIAGANSFVASHFVHELLSQNYHVIALVRGSETKSAEERMKQALKDTTLELPEQTENLTIIDYELSDGQFALTDEKLQSVFDGELDYFHFAASLKFDYRSKEEIFETNIGGLQNALQLFNRFTTKEARFYFISTAYSCGIFSGVFKEKFYPDAPIESFRNYYEQSKRLAENVLHDFMENHHIDAHVVRLSQVVGNSRTGVTRTGYGIFDFAKRVQALSDQYPNQSIRILADPDANQNLIAIDTVVHDLCNLIKINEVPVIMNFVADHPIQNRKIIRSISDLLPIRLVPEKEIEKEEMNELEKMVLSGMKFTGNYIDTDIEFDTTERDKIISANHRGVNESSVFAMLAYYLDQITVDKVVKSDL